MKGGVRGFLIFPFGLVPLRINLLAAFSLIQVLYSNLACRTAPFSCFSMNIHRSFDVDNCYIVFCTAEVTECWKQFKWHSVSLLWWVPFLPLSHQVGTTTPLLNVVSHSVATVIMHLFTIKILQVL